MKKRFSLYAICFLCVMSIVGCGYQLGSIKVGDKDNLHIPIFKNNTNTYGIEGLVTEAVINRLLVDGSYKIVGKDQADYILDGEIIEYRRDANVFDRADVPGEFRITITARLTLKDAKTGKVIWTASDAYGEANYARGAYQLESERASWPAVTEDLARDITEKISDGGW
ncbi:MAG: LptE family protein [Candidatus Ancaeobacter aquaticus]|nr:LptE family protein [Candidatus Ancaeobacter aquaticus]